MRDCGMPSVQPEGAPSKTSTAHRNWWSDPEKWWVKTHMSTSNYLLTIFHILHLLVATNLPFLVWYACHRQAMRATMQAFSSDV